MRKALIGLLITATAVTPLASAEAQSWRGGRDQARSEQRAERQEQRQERREQRVEQRENRSFARPQNNEVARNWQGRQGGQVRDYQRQPQQQAWQGRSDRPDRQVRQGRVERPAQQQYAQQNWRDRSDRRDPRQSDARRWDGNRNGNWDRTRSGNWDRNRSGNWDRNRNGDWNRHRSTRDWSRNWNRNWRHDNRYDWQRYRYSNRSIFRGGRYYAPYRDYRYSRFSIGFFLDPLFYSSRYWIADPWQYRLPPAYPGTHWVRYYNDVLLVDTYSGEVVDVIYDFFW